MQSIMHKNDRRTLMLTFLTSILHLLPYVFHLEPKFTYLFVIPLVFMVISNNGIAHNHCHVPTIRIKWLNHLFDILLSFNIGYPCSQLKILHVQNHHGKFGTLEDWSGPHQMHGRKSFLGLITYLFNFQKRIHQKDGLYFELKNNPMIQQENLIELLIIPINLFLIYLNPKIYFTYNFPAVIMGGAFALWTNIFQHAPCEPHSKYNHSLNFTGKIYNFFLVNSGYHTFHHDFPLVHWSKLPELHQTKIDPYIKPEYNQKNILIFLYRYLIKGKL
jgi:fatty acid desaturase